MSFSALPRGSPALSGTRQGPLGRPLGRPRPRPGVSSPQVSARGPRPRGSLLPLRARPFPSPSLAEIGGRRAGRTQHRPSRRGCKGDVSQAKPAPPPAAAATGAAGAARRVRQGCRAHRNAPGGRYLVGGHRAEALEDGHDVLLAGVPHGRRRTEGAAGPADWEGLTRSGCRLPEIDDDPGGGAARDGQAPPTAPPTIGRTRRSSLRTSLSYAAGSAHSSPHPALHARAQKAPAPFPGPRLLYVQGSGWRT